MHFIFIVRRNSQTCNTVQYIGLSTGIGDKKDKSKSTNPPYAENYVCLNNILHLVLIRMFLPTMFPLTNNEIHKPFIPLKMPWGSRRGCVLEASWERKSLKNLRHLGRKNHLLAPPSGLGQPWLWQVPDKPQPRTGWSAVVRGVWRCVARPGVSKLSSVHRLVPFQFPLAQ